MRRLIGFAAKAAKTVLLVVWGSLTRIGKAEGEGVFEVAMQNAVSEIAGRYVRSVTSG